MLGALEVVFQVVAGFVVEIGFEFFYKAFSPRSCLFLHCPSSFSDLRWFPFPQAVLPVGAAFSFSF